MKTFKFSLVALVATALFTACTNEAVVEPFNGKKGEAQEISFRLQGGTPEITTRSTATTLPYVDAFVVYGTDNVYGDASIFDGTTVSLDVNSDKFTYAPTRYYDFAATDAAFIAYSPASAKVTNATVANLWTVGASFDYTVPAPDNSGNTVQEDLLVASEEITPIASTVNLQFEHALARIFVTATNSTKDPVFIDSLILKNLATTGTLEFDAASAYAWEWTNQTDVADYKYILAPSGVAVDSMTTKKLVTTMEQGMMVLPQETLNSGDNTAFVAGDFALQVNYRFSNLGAQVKYILIEDGFEFKPNEQYLINIEFKGTAIDFDITVRPFDAPVEVDPPTNP